MLPQLKVRTGVSARGLSREKLCNADLGGWGNKKAREIRQSAGQHSEPS
jgi:hypothetical protein